MALLPGNADLGAPDDPPNHGDLPLDIILDNLALSEGLNAHCVMRILRYLNVKDLLLHTCLINRFWYKCSVDSLVKAAEVGDTVYVGLQDVAENPELVVVHGDHLFFDAAIPFAKPGFYINRTYAKSPLIAAARKIEFVSDREWDLSFNTKGKLYPPVALLFPHLSNIRILQMATFFNVEKLEQVLLTIANAPRLSSSLRELHIVYENVEPGPHKSQICSAWSKFLGKIPGLSRLVAHDVDFLVMLTESSEEDNAIFPNISDLEIQEEITEAQMVATFQKISKMFPNLKRLDYSRGQDDEPGLEYTELYEQLLNFTNLEQLIVYPWETMPRQVPDSVNAELRSVTNLCVTGLLMKESNVSKLTPFLMLFPNVKKVSLKFSVTDGPVAKHKWCIVERMNRKLGLLEGLTEFCPLARKCWQHVTDLDIQLIPAYPETYDDDLDVVRLLLTEILHNSAPKLSVFTLGIVSEDNSEILILMKILTDFLPLNRLGKFTLKLRRWYDENGSGPSDLCFNKMEDFGYYELYDPPSIEELTLGLVEAAYAGKLSVVGVELEEQPTSEEVERLWKQFAGPKFKRAMLDPKDVAHPCTYLQVFAERESGDGLEFYLSSVLSEEV